MPGARDDLDYVVEGTVVTMDDASRVIPDGAVGVAGERIVAVGERDELVRADRASPRIGGRGSIVVPGLIDCHNHLGQALVREYGFEDVPNVNRVYIPSEGELSVDDVRVSALVAVAQLLRSGVTTVAETTGTPAHEDAIVEVVTESGIRCAMARGRGDRRASHAGNYDQGSRRSSFDDDPGLLAEDLARTEDFVRRLQDGANGRLRPWIHTGSVLRCSDARFVELRALAERCGTGLMTHINRDREEIEFALDVLGKRPLEHLHDLGILGPDFLAIHAMLTTDREIELLRQADARVAHAPIVCSDVLSAVTKVVTMRSVGVTVGLACDTVINDVLTVMRLAWLMQSQASCIPLYDPAGFTAEDAFTMGTRDGARALGWEDAIGSLEVGKQADLVVIEADNLRISPFVNPVTALVRYASGADVDSVMVAGRLVVEGGRVTTIDEGALLAQAASIYRKMGPAMEGRRMRPLATEPRLPSEVR